MNWCSEKHDEVVFEGKNCPACYVIDDLEAQIEELSKK